MTRAEIEADIAYLEEEVRFLAGCGCAECACTRRSLQIRRDMLAKLDGPSDGARRIVIEIVASSRSSLLAYVWDSRDEAFDDAETVAFVTADIPLPRVVEIEGTVE